MDDFFHKKELYSINRKSITMSVLEKKVVHEVIIALEDKLVYNYHPLPVVLAKGEGCMFGM
jgi:hypothetical protein